MDNLVRFYYDKRTETFTDEFKNEINLVFADSKRSITPSGYAVLINAGISSEEIRILLDDGVIKE